MIFKLLAFKFLMTLFMFALISVSFPLIAKPKECLSAREYITTLEYLRSKNEFGLNENQSQELAAEVSKGCTGAARRFIRTVEVFLKYEASSRESIQLALELSQKPDAYTNTFIGVFARSYSRDHLDLDFRTSLQIARNLSVEYSGDPKIALKDYVNLVQFCTSEKHVSYSKPHCGVLASRILKSTEDFNRSIARSFRDTYQFVMKEIIPSGSPMQALELTEKIVSISPEAPKNFKTAYRYGLRDKGLGLDIKKSLEFAMGISEKSRWTPDRMPASR